MKLTSQVKIANTFPQLKLRYHRAVPRALNRSARVGAARAKQVASRRTQTGHMADIRVQLARRDRKGYIVSFSSPAFYAWFHELGTLGSRRRKLKQPGRRRAAAPPGSGLAPLGFMGAGRKAARARLLEHLAREIRNV